MRAGARCRRGSPRRCLAPNRPRDELAIKLAIAVTVPGVDVGTVIQQQRTATMVGAAGLHPAQARRPRRQPGRARRPGLEPGPRLAGLRRRGRDPLARPLRGPAPPRRASSVVERGRAATVSKPPDRERSLDSEGGPPMTTVLHLDAVTRVHGRAPTEVTRAARPSPSAPTPASWSRSWARRAPASPRCSPSPAGSTSRPPARSASRASTWPRSATRAGRGCGVRRSATSSRTST